MFHSDRTGKGIRIAVLDSGVHAQHPHVLRVAGGIGISPTGSLDDDYIDRLGHGTAVAAAIREKAPDAQIYAVKIFDGSLTTHIESLCCGLQWAIRNGMRVANLSLGTSRPEHEPPLLDAIEKARAAGLIVVAANNDGVTRWLPGSLPGVISVGLDWDCPRDEYRARLSSNGSIVFAASGYPRPIPGVPPEHNLMGQSFAVANISGFAARALEACPDATIDTLPELLRK